ncbi:ATP-dependent DNA helicase MER3 [Elasticomyces elasticus]|nr:ATP-dependent DNA helicase MER3 [Elasticomyces elasticus]
MEGSIFDTLDQLEQERGQYSDEYQDQHDGYLDQDYLSTPQHPVVNERYNNVDAQDVYEYEVPRDEYREQQSLLLETYGRARLSLPPTTSQYAHEQHGPNDGLQITQSDSNRAQSEAMTSTDIVEATQAQARAPSRLTLCKNYSGHLPVVCTDWQPAQFAYQTSGTQASSSSPVRIAPSSPTVRASQRHLTSYRQRTIPAESPLEETHGRGKLQNSNFHPSHVKSKLRASPQTLDLKHAPPVVQGIELVSTHNLPDRFRSVFPFPLFNAVQSKCFYSIYKTKDNLVLSSPTGSGKTAVFELAICSLVNNSLSDSFKIVYQAPTKSLCSERQRDWQAKFAPLGLQCAELTGDTDNNQLRNVQNASIIITTPEKWDSMTRKWKDHEKLMQLIKLFLIDEVHILKESRGATLEAVVSRMKSVGSDVRFVALSATVPNSQDIATWLGRNPTTQEVPAIRERFGEEFRPVRLQKHVCGYQSQANDFAFDKTLDVK